MIQRVKTFVFIWIVILLLSCTSIMAETIFNETMGAAATTTEIPDYTGWYNYGSANYTGTADARSTWNSAGDYPGASGAGNIYFVGGMDDYFQISGISTSGYRNIRLSLSLYKSNSNATTGNAENGSNFNISYSVDSGICWRRLPITIPTGANTVETYYWRELSEYLPATDNLTLRFTNIGTTEPVHFRMDDVTLSGDKDSIFTEPIGLGATNIEIGSFSGWSNSYPIAFSGSGYVRNDLPSTDKYTGASGGGNVRMDSGQYFQISGINTIGFTQPVLSVGVMKASAADNGSRLLMTYSTDGVNWSTPQQCNTTASGTNLWYRKHFSGLPVTANLHLKFSNTSTVFGSFRIDDIRVLSSLNTPVVGFPASSSLSATGATLSANIIGLNGANVTQRGFYYSTTANFADGAGTIVSEAVTMSQPGIYSIATGVLLPNTVYYYKAFATSSSGTSYSGQNTFTTPPVATTTTYTMNRNLPTGGTNFQTYGEAVTYLNANFAASSTGYTFLVKDGQVFEDTSTTSYNITASGTAAKQIIFQRDYSGNTRPKLSRTSSSVDMIVLSGADWVTFDGIDVQVTGRYGIYIANYNTITTNGSQHNTIKNCTITGGPYYSSYVGIAHGYTNAATPTSEAGKHSYNMYQNITINGFKNGIVLDGVASEIEISGCTITNCVSGYYSTSLKTTGIKATDITNLKVFNNDVSNLYAEANFPIGINIATCKGNVDVYNNKIYDLRGVYDTEMSMVLAAGIQVIPADEESNIRIYNNMIGGMDDYSDGAPGVIMLRGIYVASGYINGSLSIDFNTIYISGSCSAAGIRLSSPYANIRNNVISMGSTSPTNNYYGIYYDNLSPVGGVTDYNVIYITNPAMGRYIYAAGNTYNLEGWQIATGREAASWIYDPKLISSSNMHITPGADTPVESNASNYNGSISWVTHDIDGEPRNLSAPDIGADEGVFTFNAPLIPSNPISLSVIPLNAEEITFAATANSSGNPILLAYNTSNTFGIPSGIYANEAAIQGGGTVIHMGSVDDLGILSRFSPSTTYYFKAWSYVATERTTWYTYSSGITVSGTTPARITLPAVITVNPAGSGSNNYTSLSAALNAIDVGTVPTGGITVNVAANYTQTITSAFTIDFTGTSTQPIIIQKDPATSGANPLITRSDSGSISTSLMGGYGDSVIRIEGSDYLTISGIDVYALDSGIEYGYLTHKPSATNGSQYLNIRNCNINMTKGSSPYVTGIYIGNGTTAPDSKIGHTVTATSGENRYVKVSGTVVLNAHTGIRVQGSAATGYWDNHITIGQLGLLNEIISFGGVADSTSYGVVFYNVTDPTVVATSIDNSMSPSAGDVYGIYIEGLYSKEADEPRLHLNMVEGDVQISDNYIKLANTSLSGVTNYIYHFNTCNSETISNNTFAAGVISTEGNTYLIEASNQCITKTISGNATEGTFTLTGPISYLTAYNSTLANTFGHTWDVTEVLSNNNFSNIIATGLGHISGFSSYDTKKVFGNTMSNWSTQGPCGGLTVGNDQDIEIYNNQIQNITASIIWSGISIYGGNDGIVADCYNNVISNLTMTEPGTLIGIGFENGIATANCYNNTVSGLSGTHPGTTVVGIILTSVTTLSSIYNNMIFGLSALGTDTITDMPTVAGIKDCWGNISNIFYNTVLLNGNSSGAGYSSAALYLSLDDTDAAEGCYARIRNNIFVNKSVPGSLGKSVAFWKITTGNTAMGASSNDNIYYAGIPDARHLIAYLGTQSCPTLAEYKQKVSTVDQASFTEDVPFISSSGTLNVHINPTIPTFVQNQATPISGYTTDIDGQTRGTNTPDIGADEGSFTIAPTCTTPTAQPTNLILVPNHNSISIQFTPSVAQEFLVLRHTTSTPSVTPVSGTLYWPGQALGNATVVSSNEATACLATGLSSSTQYYISVYALNNFGLAAPKYLTTSPLRLAVTTLSTSHNQPSAFTATTINSTSVALNVSPNAAGDNIIVAYSYDPNFGTPFGNYSIGATINGGGTIIYMGSAAGLSSHTGLYPWTKVYFKAWSYYSINRAIYYSYSNGVTANAKTTSDPLVGTKTVNPNILGANNFISISEAVAAFNYAGVGTGGVTINIMAGYVDTLSAPLVFSNSGSESSPAIFQKDPATTGANPIIIRNDEGSFAASILGGNGDSIIRIEGSDYLTFDGIDVQSGNSAIEYGYFATKPSEINGCQNLYIKNCNITMSKVEFDGTVVAGIYISNGPTSIDNSNGVTVTASSGQNCFVTISGNTIRNTNNGILLIGSTTPGFPDSDYFVGTEGGANTIENYAGFHVAGIYAQNINNPAICYNTINNTAGGGSANIDVYAYGFVSMFCGIKLTGVTGEIAANYNAISITVDNRWNTSYEVYWINNTGTGNRESYLGNTFSSGNGFYNDGISHLISLNNGTPQRIVSDNSTIGLISNTKYKKIVGYYSTGSAPTGSETVTNNNFSNIESTDVCGMYINSDRAGNRIYSGNTISNIISGSEQSLVGIYCITPTNITCTISNNTISNLTGRAFTTAIKVENANSVISGNIIDNVKGAYYLYGISQTGGYSICRNNLISNLTGTAYQTPVRGIRLSCSSETYNNIIHSLRGNTNDWMGICLSGIETFGSDTSITHKIYYNTVLLSGSGTASGFSTAGMMLGNGSHDLRNNIIVNNATPDATGYSTAIWKSGATSTIATTSNNNIFYAGIISTSAPYRNMIGNIDGVIRASLSAYQTSVAPAEQNSYTENVPFVSSIAPLNLHINPGNATYAESRAMPIAGYDTDFDGETRNSITPDIGAYEGYYTPLNLAPLPAITPSPADLATEQLTDVQLSWSRSTGGAAPTSYNVYFGTTNPPTLIGNQETTTYNPGTLAANQTYYWKVDPSNISGLASTGNTLPVWSFTTYNPLPEAAVLVSPVSGATGIAINPSLNWTAGTGFAPLGYKLYLGTDNPPTNLINGTDLGNVTSYAFLSRTQRKLTGSNNASSMATPSTVKTELDAIQSRNSLSYNTTYYWKVVPYTLAGNAATNAVWSFVTELPPVPNATINPTPADMSVNQPVLPYISWQADAEGTEPDSYKVYFGTTNPPQLMGSQVGTSFNSGALNYGTTYYWMIDPHNISGYSSSEHTLPVWSFTTIPNPYPTPAVAVNPLHDATEVVINPTLQWSAGSGATPTGYLLAMGTDNPPSNLINYINLGNVLSYQAPELAPNTTYYWHVLPYTEAGYPSENVIWSFTTALPPLPLVAIDSVPTDLSTSVSTNIELSWSPNPEGTVPIGYNVYFGTSNPPALVGNEITASYNPGTLEYGTTYYWQIDPQSAHGFSSQTNILPVWSFTTEQSPYPTQAILVSPANGSNIVDTGSSLSWSAGIGATPTGYRISFGTDNPPTNLINGMDLGNVTTCNPAGLIPNTTYYWQVQAYNSLGDAPPATVWSFSIAVPSVSIGTGTGVNRSPFGTAYGYERDATLYTAAEIGNLGQPIRSLAWYATRSVTTNTPIKVYLKATSATVLPSVNWANTISGATLVYNSTVSSIAANAWMNLALGTAFTLAPGSNLMVLIETNYGGSGSGNSLGGGFRNTNYSPVNTLHKYWFSNTSPPTTTGSFDILRANIRISSSDTVVELPGPAVASSPLNGATNVPLTASLNWASGGGNVSGYRLYMGTDGDGVSTPTNLIYGLDLGNTLSYTPPNSLAYATTHYWQVIPYNSSGTAINASIWSFTTQSEPVPSLAEPTNLVVTLIDGTLSISWDSVPNAVGYRIFSSDDPNALEWGTPRATTSTTNFTEAVSQSKCFYKIVATSTAP